MWFICWFTLRLSRALLQETSYWWGATTPKPVTAFWACVRLELFAYYYSCSFTWSHCITYKYVLIRLCKAFGLSLSQIRPLILLVLAYFSIFCKKKTLKLRKLLPFVLFFYVSSSSHAKNHFKPVINKLNNCFIHLKSLLIKFYCFKFDFTDLICINWLRF